MNSHFVWFFSTYDMQIGITSYRNEKTRMKRNVRCLKQKPLRVIHENLRKKKLSITILFFDLIVVIFGWNRSINNKEMNKIIFDERHNSSLEKSTPYWTCKKIKFYGITRELSILEKEKENRRMLPTINTVYLLYVFVYDKRHKSYHWNTSDFWLKKEFKPFFIRLKINSQWNK